MVKRTFDIVVSLVALLLLAPVMIVIGVLIFMCMGRPVIFRHTRPGKDRKLFGMLKFRTMRAGNDLPDEQRVTRLGAFLRKASLDELPQFLNVLSGTMSIVGPRPSLACYLPYYTEEESVRFSVKPGITGLAQISGRNAIGWNARLAIDVEYVKNRSFLGDLIIILKTIPYVLTQKGVQCCERSHSQRLDQERGGL